MWGGEEKIPPSIQRACGKRKVSSFPWSGITPSKSQWEILLKII
jgi:hypothetical protein